MAGLCQLFRWFFSGDMEEDEIVSSEPSSPPSETVATPKKRRSVVEATATSGWRDSRGSFYDTREAALRSSIEVRLCGMIDEIENHHAMNPSRYSSHQVCKQLLQNREEVVDLLMQHKTLEGS